MAASTTKSKIILITGNPGVGKTTLVKKLHDKLSQDVNIKKLLSGFYTEEVRDNSNQRIGFDIIDLNDDSKRTRLARSLEQESYQLKNAPKVGKYSVDIKSFESIALPILNKINPNSIYLVDEIGKMEILSNLFQTSVNQLLNALNSNNILLVATVPNKPLAFSDKIKSNALSKLYTVTFQNRNKILDEIFELIIDSFKA